VSGALTLTCARVRRPKRSRRSESADRRKLRATVIAVVIVVIMLRRRRTCRRDILVFRDDRARTKKRPVARRCGRGGRRSSISTRPPPPPRVHRVRRVRAFVSIIITWLSNYALCARLAYCARVGRVSVTAFRNGGVVVCLREIK